MGRNQSHTEGESDAESLSTSDTLSRSQSLSRSAVHNEHSAESHSESENTQAGKSRTVGSNRSRAVGTQEGHSVNRSLSASRQDSRSRSNGSNRGLSLGETESEVPFLRPKEYQELAKRTFWTKDELLYMATAAIKNQDRAQAFIRIGSEPPVRTDIDYVTPTPYHPRRSPPRDAAFRQAVFRANPDFYAPADEARKLSEERQRRIFGEPIRFDERLSLSRGALIDGEMAGEQSPEDPFEA